MLEIMSSSSGRKDRCALHDSRPGHRRSHLVSDCRRPEAGQQGGMQRTCWTYLQLIAAWKVAALHYTFPHPEGCWRGMQRPISLLRRTVMACRGSRKEDLPPVETLHAVNMEGRTLS